MTPGAPAGRLAVLVSGSGSNLQALLDACREGRLAAEVALVVSSRPGAYALERARAAGVPARVMPYRRGDSREAYDAAVADAVEEARPDLVVMAGWMHVFTPAFLDRFPGRVLNLHPALPGEFPGTRALERAYEAWTRGEAARSGCMVHLAVPEVDAGPVVAMREVPFVEGDTLDAFADRVHRAEHEILVEAVGTELRRPGGRPRVAS